MNPKNVYPSLLTNDISVVISMFPCNKTSFSQLHCCGFLAALFVVYTAVVLRRFGEVADSNETDTTCIVVYVHIRRARY